VGKKSRLTSTLKTRGGEAKKKKKSVPQIFSLGAGKGEMEKRENDDSRSCQRRGEGKKNTMLSAKKYKEHTCIPFVGGKREGELRYFGTQISKKNSAGGIQSTVQGKPKKNPRLQYPLP